MGSVTNVFLHKIDNREYIIYRILAIYLYFIYSDAVLTVIEAKSVNYIRGNKNIQYACV